MKKFICLIWIIGCIGEFLVPFILSTRLKNYSNLKTVMSAIATRDNGIVAIIYSLWLIFFGAMVTAISILVRNNSSIGTYKAAITILALYGIGCIVCGIFPVDETKEMVTISAKIHGSVAVVTFSLLMFIPLLMRRTLIVNNLNSLSLISIFVFVVAFILFVLQIASEREQFSRVFLGNTGLWQRLYLATIYSYIFVAFYNIKGA